jgi:hypothetical protein
VSELDAVKGKQHPEQPSRTTSASGQEADVETAKRRCLAVHASLIVVHNALDRDLST